MDYQKKCQKCGAPTRPNVDGDSRYDPPLPSRPSPTSELVAALELCLEAMTDGDAVEPDAYIPAINKARAALAAVKGGG